MCRNWSFHWLIVGEVIDDTEVSLISAVYTIPFLRLEKKIGEKIGYGDRWPRARKGASHECKGKKLAMSVKQMKEEE